MDESYSIRKGSILGGVLLVAGCCIGAGMLGLPVLSALAGFNPSLLMFFVSWVYMATTGMLLLEVNLWFSEEVSIVSMAERTLGFTGKAFSWFVFLFLFYSLMVAYAAASGSLVADFIKELVGIQAPHWIGSLLISALFGILIYLGTHAVDQFNRLLMIGLIAAYAFLIYMGASYVNPTYLEHHDWTQIGYIVPAMIVSFGFHNLVPSLTTYFKRDIKPLRLVIIIGSAVPLLIYIVWQWLILGIVPFEGEGGIKAALDHGEMATQALRAAVGSSIILKIAEAFAFFAIVTSFLGVALSFVDFLADGLKIAKTNKGKALLCFLALAPPFVFALIYPTIFLSALNYAGGLGAVSLFGILPALMVWRGRYTFHGRIDQFLAKKSTSNHEEKQLVGLESSYKTSGLQIVPGGKPVLIMVIAFALWVMSLQLVS